MFFFVANAHLHFFTDSDFASVSYYDVDIFTEALPVTKKRFRYFQAIHRCIEQ